MKRRLAFAVATIAVLAHVWAVGDHWRRAQRYSRGLDFASYHYAVKAAWMGGNPYNAADIALAVRAEGRGGTVHPFFYPPPFLAAMVWTAATDVTTAYRVWFWLDELFAVLCALVLWRWWRPLGPALPVVLAVAVATLTAIPNNHMMGQFNLPVLFLVLAGLWQAESGRTVLGGALVGTACMLKMSPAFFVAWWLLRREWTAVGAACGTAVVLSLLALPVAGPAVQWHFYTEVLPGFGSGDYNGLTVPIMLFGNHGLPDIYNRLWPGPPPGQLTPTARAASIVTLLVVVGGLAAWFRRPPRDAWQRAAQPAAIAIAILLVPVYTYEHHLVWALPAAVVAAMAVLAGRVPRWWAVPLALAWTACAFELSTLRVIWLGLRDTEPVAAAIVRDLKLGGLLGLLGLSAALGRASHYPGARDVRTVEPVPR